MLGRRHAGSLHDAPHHGVVELREDRLADTCRVGVGVPADLREHAHGVLGGHLPHVDDHVGVEHGHGGRLTEGIHESREQPQRDRVVTDGSAVLGLADIGPAASLPVVEGKAALFTQFSGVDARLGCLDTQDTEEIIMIVMALAPSTACRSSST